MPYEKRTYWVVDSNGKKHLSTREELVDPTPHELRLRAIMDLLMKRHGDALRRLAHDDQPDMDS